MKKMSNESNLQVTFSKRRSGLFKKASELCTLCGADVALVVFSPGDKVFSFGHPNVDAVIDRYLARAPQPNTGTMHFIEAHRVANVRDLNVQLTQINGQLESERKRADELARLKRATQAQLWWASPIDDMSRVQLDQYKVALEELKKHVARLADRAMLQSAANPSHHHHHFFPGASSSSNVVNQPHNPQMFPPQMIQPSMLQNYMFPDGTIMHPNGFNNMGFGPGNGGFF
uniref:Agamous-like MADS-box protein AGL62 n=2 Tax=Cajanus cajan TaxID=3821 RepID=A0A151U7N6_CAJCA|nr:Agamous-like MADS-box protein AGL62 [Cajanus cajan]